MLAAQAIDGSDRRPAIDLHADTLPTGIIWIDLVRPTDDEIAYVSRVTGLRVPTWHDIREIETSSRLQVDDGVFHLSTPILFHDPKDGLRATAVGFVLTPKLLLSIRFEDLKSFEDFGRRDCALDPALHSSAGVWIGILEAIVDRAADVLEDIGMRLDEKSRLIFHSDGVAPANKTKRDEALTHVLRELGRLGDLTTNLRGALVGIGRLVPYVVGNAEWLPERAKPHLETIRQDVASLNDYDTHLSEKTQFLLDATLGFISIDQNNTFKVLTIASVIGIPPTLIASMYGMNFKLMPELNWTYGYPYALVLILLSGVLPGLWLKWRGWF